MSRAEDLRAEGHIIKPCRGCGKPMVWAMKETGLWLPLDPVPPVYSVLEVRDRFEHVRPMAVRNMNALVLHHVTCPKREIFAGVRRSA